MSQNIELYDAVIVGGGPAGLTAALYLARARYRVLVVEKERFGGQITITHEVVNYPGVERTSGEALTETMRRQAQNFGAEFLLAEVTALKLEGEIKEITTTRGTLRAFAVMIATGANPRKLGFPGEQEFRGRGVAYCATCDGEFFTGKELLVIGGGYAAAEEALFLTRYASKITMLVRRDCFSCAKSIADEVCAHPKIKVLFEHELVSASGNDMGINQAEIVCTKTGEKTIYQAANHDTFGIFVFAGYVPNTALVQNLVQLDDSGYVITDTNMQTSVPGVFAGGDVCIKSLRQVVTATADGALAACAMEKVAARAHETTGLVPVVPNATRKAPEEPRASMAPEPETTSFISADMVGQLNAVFERMQSKLILQVQLGSDDKSAELLAAMQELAALTDKLECTSVSGEGEHLPCVRILRADGTWTGLAFHGVPGGHEFTSFILGLYNAAGPGQAVEPDDLTRAQALGATKLQILISLSCTMCPDLVTAAQRVASLNDKVTAEVYDVNLYPELRTRYKVMSVPCLVVNDEHISFGRKNLSELLTYLATL
ncbi:MAG: FAD-dependent oxidoreductase [Candidatus Anaerobiospirillum merdipullorum]|uniref:Alkyl hydroperoxide reductase subunit F n=1 Tax=Candidatus Anaerobiospirillum merdipullorum TaxID=2838450 RepID=A0A9E2KP17_9GAMM|nr:FAD-dependent oxidoreductase [Candidatus Anaerobiospirillum merdipullorum]